VERKPDVGVPVDRERLPRLLLERTRLWGDTGHEDDVVGIVTVDQAAWNAAVAGVGDLGLDGADAALGLVELRRGARDGDHSCAGRGECCRDASA
jgi:hypothetical protein